MNEERKRELEDLLDEAMGHVEIRSQLGDRYSLLPMSDYGTYLQERHPYYWAHYNPHIVDKATKSKLIGFLSEELAPFIRENRILSVSSFIFQDPPGNGFHMNDLLGQLLKIAIIRGIKGAISAFGRCTENKPASFQYIALLEGINIETKKQIFDGIALLPLPCSTSELPHYLINLFPDMSAVSLLGKTLLVIDFVASPIFHKPLTEATLEERSDQQKKIFRSEIRGGNCPNFNVANFSVWALCHALSLACNSAVEIGFDSTVLAEDEPFNLSHRTYRSPWKNDGPFGPSAKAGEAEIDKAKHMYHILVNPDSEVGKRLQIPINRWIKSKASWNAVNQMIDLGIGFEALYLSDIKDRAELSFRLRLHVAWHLGKDKVDRKALMKEFGKIYEWRSLAVHTGKLPNKKKKVPFTTEEVAEFIARAQDLCRDSILKIIEDEEFPDWGNLILGE